MGATLNKRCAIKRVSERINAATHTRHSTMTTTTDILNAARNMDISPALDAWTAANNAGEGYAVADDIDATHECHHAARSTSDVYVYACPLTGALVLVSYDGWAVDVAE